MKKEKRKKIILIFLNGHVLLFKKYHLDRLQRSSIILYVYVYSAFIPEKRDKMKKKRKNRKEHFKRKKNTFAFEKSMQIHTQNFPHFRHRNTQNFKIEKIYEEHEFFLVFRINFSKSQGMRSLLRVANILLIRFRL